MAPSRRPDTGRNPRIPTAKKKEETQMDAMVEALKPIIIFAMVLWGIETVVTMLIKDHKQAIQTASGALTMISERDSS